MKYNSAPCPAAQRLIRTRSADAKPQTVRETLGELRSGAQQVEASLWRLIEDTANRDDRELSNVEKLVSELGHNCGESILVQKDRLCAALAGFSVNSVKCRLTRIYLATVWSTQNSCDTSTVGHNNMEGELMAEIDSLYDEIMSVTEMSIGREFSQLSLPFLCLSVSTLRRTLAARHFRE